MDWTLDWSMNESACAGVRRSKKVTNSGFMYRRNGTRANVPAQQHAERLNSQSTLHERCTSLHCMWEPIFKNFLMWTGYDVEPSFRIQFRFWRKTKIHTSRFVIYEKFSQSVRPVGFFSMCGKGHTPDLHVTNRHFRWECVSRFFDSIATIQCCWKIVRRFWLTHHTLCCTYSGHRFVYHCIRTSGQFWT